MENDALFTLVSGRTVTLSGAGLDGSGTTQLSAGSDLTATHIIQSALVIGGTAGRPGLVTIAASDASGNSLINLADLASPFAAELPMVVGGELGKLMGDGFSGELATASHAPLSSSAPTGIAGVPEPSSLILLAIGSMAVGGTAVRRRRTSPYAYHYASHRSPRSRFRPSWGRCSKPTR
jgi:hypothetical protein